MLITINLHSSIYCNSILDDILSPIACLVLRKQCHVVLLLNLIYRIEIETRLDLKSELATCASFWGIVRVAFVS